MLGDPVFWQVLRNSVVWTAGVVLLQNCVGFLIALLLNQRLPMQGVLRVAGAAALGAARRGGRDPLAFHVRPAVRADQFVHDAARADRPGRRLAGRSAIGDGAVIFVAFWKGFPFSTVVYLAALQNVDQEQIEAAKVDGAGPVRRLFDVVLPAIRDVAATNILLTTILTFNYFDIIYVLTRGGPLNATAIFPTRIYEVGFGQFRFGEAAAYGATSVVVLVLLVALLAVRSATAEASGMAPPRRTGRVRWCCCRSRWRWCLFRSSGCSASR